MPLDVNVGQDSLHRSPPGRQRHAVRQARSLRQPRWAVCLRPGCAAATFRPMTGDALAIPRYKTAIHRADLSRPLRCALEDGLIDAAVSVFDYGCGHGQDIELLQER